MISCNLMGGLGNQLFQIFAVISYAIKTNNDFQFKNDDILSGGEAISRKTYWRNFLLNLSNTGYTILGHSIIRESDFRYNELPRIEYSNIILSGYFQSYKYFQEHYNIICKIIDLNKRKQMVFQKTINVELDKTVSIHFRLGDYKKYPHHHPIMKYEYYKNALSYITNSTSITSCLYFCEDEDLQYVEETIDKLSLEYPNINMIRADNILDDWEQMILMSLCKYNIIANSTFSWWGGYFNENPEKIVCYPSIWFGPAINSDLSDLFPVDWIKIGY
jgi:hypothetical protein